MNPTRHLELADYIHELADTHRKTELYTTHESTGWAERSHHVTVPALVRQLVGSDPQRSGPVKGPRPGYGSRPAARLDALDALALIDGEAARWVRYLGEDDRHHDTASTLRQLHSLAVAQPHEVRSAVTADVRRWWVRARIVTGWDSAPWTPNVVCPHCGERGTLRIRLADQIALCTNHDCRVWWDHETIGLLADYIREESGDSSKGAAGVGPCWCPVPKPPDPDLSRLCRGCGSARCRHAVGARLLDSIRAEAS